MTDSVETQKILTALTSVKQELEEIRKLVYGASRRSAFSDYRLWAAARAMLGKEVNNFTTSLDVQTGHDYSLGEEPVNTLRA